MRVRVVLTLIGAVALAAPAAAQFGPPKLEDAPVVEELVVRGYGGPPWWKVSDKDTTVYILADPGMLPPGVSFDTTLLEKRITGANEVITPSELRLGLGALLAMPSINSLLKKMNGGTRTDLEAKLPPDLRARFVAGREKINMPATRYGALPIGLAGMALAGDARVIGQGQRLPPKGSTHISQYVSKVRQAKRIRAAPAKVYSGGAFNAFFSDMDRPSLECLRATLDEMEHPPAARLSPAEQTRIARAWAEGDIRPMVTAARATFDGSGVLDANFGKKGTVRLLMHETCLKAMPKVNAINQRWAVEEAAAIARALKRKGHAVAILDPGTLLTQGGVLDILRRQGYTVKAPNDD